MNCSGSGLSSPRDRRTCSMDSGVAAAPANWTAGSPGRARVSRKLITITPMMTGMACAMRKDMAATRPLISALRSAQAADIELAVEPEFIAVRTVDGDIERRLVKRNAGQILEGDLEHAFDLGEILRIILRHRQGFLRQLRHLVIMIVRGIEQIPLQIGPVVVIVRRIEPAAEVFKVERQLLFDKRGRSPARAGDFLDF